jgi:hypothetical protein
MRLIPAFVLTLMVSVPAGQLEASEWGCEILLCAISDNPSWQGVATCQAPMQRLIAAMKQPGFSWPTCPEGGAGIPGYEKYADCPVGWTPSPGDGADHGGQSEPSRCSLEVDECRSTRPRPESGTGSSRFVGDGDVMRVYPDHGSCRDTETSARPLRDKPYYFDFKDEADAVETRHFFSLSK